ncbi:hypothetical protein OF83DRAFT_493825 [Amylostereum chailletii]|nr:hypothetical protein OF83DRAFT_493825 [Amylostereum chailletii]
MSAPTPAPSSPAPSSPAPLPHFDLRNTFGAIFLGGTASVGILGITVLQAWLYYSNYPDDRRFVKLLVAVVCIIEFIRSSFTVAATYHYLVTEWGNPLALNQNIWTLDIVVFMTNLGELFGHLYFAWRVWILSRGRLRLVLTSLIVCIPHALQLGIKASTLTQISEGPITVLSPVALGTAIATDIVIMLSLIFLLHRGRTGFSKTNRLINTLIFYAIQVGSITAITDPSTPWWEIFTQTHYLQA